MGDVDCTLAPGTINGLLPTNYNSVFTVSATATFFVVLSVTASSGELASATINFNSSPPAAVPVNMGPNPHSLFDYLLGILVNGIWYRTIGPGGLAAAGAEVFRASKLSPAPGTLPYDIYYTWNLTNN